MESYSGRAFHQLQSREIQGRRGCRKLCVQDYVTGFVENGAFSVEHDGEETPPLAISFGKTNRASHILAVSDEDGFVSLIDTRRRFSQSISYRENTEKAAISEWNAHKNSIFDVCWIKDDTQILTGSGDQTIKLWDVQEKKCLGDFTGHTGSVKSLCSHPFNPDVFVSGSRDGSFIQWDLRCKSGSRSRRGEIPLFSPTMVNRVHAKTRTKQMKRKKTSSMSITSVLYLQDGTSVATAGSVDSVVKFWDARNLKTQQNEISPYNSESITSEEKRMHGVCSLSQDSSGSFLSASCMDNRVYLYSLLQLGNGPVKCFSGSLTGSFFVKSSISPDAEHILSGSSDGKAYIWQVGKPHADPITLNNHQGEVTAVSWCPSEAGKIATASDDFTVRIWDIENNCSTSARSPYSIRRRVMAVSPFESGKLITNDGQAKPDSISGSPTSKSKLQLDNNLNASSVTTPKSTKSSFSTSFDFINKATTSETDMESPSSVLCPSSSLKRKTIRDYFVMSS